MCLDFQASFRKRDEFISQVIQGKRDLFSFQTAEGMVVRSSMCSIRKEKENPDKDITTFTLVCTPPAKDFELHLECKIFHKFPYFEYETFFHNPNNTRSDVIDGFRHLDVEETITRAYYGSGGREDYDASSSGNRIKVTYCLGTTQSGSDFLRLEKILFPRPCEDQLHVGVPGYGRCSENALPFFRVDLDDMYGFDIGIGWSGNWIADFEMKRARKDGDAWQDGKIVAFSSGMPNSRFYLNPSETLRAPGSFLGFRCNISTKDFINVHRRFMMACHAPHDSQGNLLVPPLCLCSWGGVESENMKKILSLTQEKKLPFEVHWIDAGWMGDDGPCPHFCDNSMKGIESNWWKRVGTFRTNRYSHPDGIQNITDFARKMGLKTMLWFEPERFCKDCGSPLLSEHPEYFLKASEDSFLVDLGNVDARRYLTENILKILNDEKVEYYRQDFNINPFDAWKAADEPNRIGVSEMKHIDGLYCFWKDLRKARPDMFIDNCASGGRRMDYMLADFSFPMCQSDYPTFWKYDYTCLQLENFFLNEVYPLHSSLSWMPETDLYALFSSGCGMGIGSKLWQFPSRYPDSQFNFDRFREVLVALKKIREYLVNGNYYALTPNAIDVSEFCAMQSHDPEKNAGFVMVFRRMETQSSEFCTLLPEINQEKRYSLWEFGSTKTQVISGEELHRFYVELPMPRSVRLFFYAAEEEH